MIQVESTDLAMKMSGVMSSGINSRDINSHLILVIFLIICGGSLISVVPLTGSSSSLIDGPEVSSLMSVDDISPYTSCFSPDGKWQIYGSRDNKSQIYFIDISTEPKDEYNKTNFEITVPVQCPVVKITGDGEHLAAGGCWDNVSEASSIFIINISAREIVNQINISHQYFEISPDGKYLAVHNNNSFSGIYWASNGTLFKRFGRNTELITFSPGGGYIMVFNTGGSDNINILKFPDMENMLTLEGRPNFRLSPNRGNILSWSKDSSLVAVVVHSKNTLYIIDTEDWKIVKKFTRFDKDFYLSSVLFSPEGTKLAAGGTRIEALGASLGYIIYDTGDWSVLDREANRWDYRDDIRKSYPYDDKYAIYDSMSWYSENRLHLSATMYKGTLVLDLEDVQDTEKPPEDLGMYDIDYALTITAAVSVIVILSVLGTLSYLGFLPNPLYSKLKRSEIQNQVTRNNIMHYIETHPGCDFTEVRGFAESSSSNVYYHLSVLEREDLIFSKTSGVKRRFYVSNFPRLRKTFQEQERKGIHEKIYLLLIDHPGLTQKEIAKRLNISEATVSRYVLDMLTENFLRRERDGNIWKCYAKFDGSEI